MLHGTKDYSEEISCLMVYTFARFASTERRIFHKKMVNITRCLRMEIYYYSRDVHFLLLLTFCLLFFSKHTIIRNYITTCSIRLNDSKIYAFNEKINKNRMLISLLPFNPISK